VARALGRLRGAASVHGLFRSATCALCDSVGFGRAAVFSLQGGALVAESLYQGARGERDLVRVSSQPFELGPGLRETEVLRRRTTILVEDVSSDPRAVGMLGGARSFVAAPIVCHEQAVGLIHADHGLTGEAVTELDRATLAVFAEGFGQAVERCVLSGRLRAHSQRVLALVRSTEASVTELGSAEFGLRSPAGRVPAARVHNGDGLHSLLTRRELEVVAMLAEGETNARIAQRLVVSEDTVKSHVKHILRKLGVHNRSQAVSRYFQAQTAS
jgi:DNA-binding CsgD family transcriptional regulator/putative methionine-R-sulfoxide reductase with GAF domain